MLDDRNHIEITSDTPIAAGVGTEVANSPEFRANFCLFG
jgi:hypothetical protein